MRILRLGNSDDLSASVPESERGYAIAARQLEAIVGEPCETIVKPIWPDRGLPELVDRWLDRHEPDVVFLKVTWFWYGYESVPLRVERVLGRLGKPFARAGVRAAENPRLSHNRLFKAGRRLAHRLIGGDAPFPPDVVIERMEACIRRIVAREGIVLVVKGTGGGRKDEEALQGYFGRFTRKREHVEGAIARLCGQLHVTYVGTGGPKTREERDVHGGDGLHKGVLGHHFVGLQEGEALVQGWLATHPDRRLNRRLEPSVEG